MSKTFKSCTIFFISGLWLVLARIVFSNVNLSDNLSSWLFSFIVQVIGMGIIPLTLYKLWIKEDIISGFSLNIKIPKIVYVIAIVLGFLLSYVTLGVSLIWQNVLALLGFTHINAPGTIYSGVEVLILELLCTAVLPAIFEELTDRGLALQMFKDIEDDKVKMVLIAILFGLAHQNIMQTGYAFIGGLIFAFLAIKTKSIIPGMIIHFINNALSVISGYSSQHNGFVAKIEDAVYAFITNYFLIALITWIGAAFLIIWLLKKTAEICAKDRPAEEKVSDSYGYFFPQKVQYIDDLFGNSLTRDLIVKKRSAWYEYAFLYAYFAMTFATTLFTFIWGIWR